MNISVPHIKKVDGLSAETKRVLTYIGVIAGAYAVFKLTQHIVRSIRVSSLETQFGVK